ncbi:MAG: hypothetical protein CMQ29_10025 [Gammaproteobacteria bacterium]|nr:hypothetical protein [Gammaproteobacteria bacterium]
MDGSVACGPLIYEQSDLALHVKKIEFMDDLIAHLNRVLVHCEGIGSELKAVAHGRAWQLTLRGLSTWRFDGAVVASGDGFLETPMVDERCLHALDVERWAETVHEAVSSHKLLARR